MARNSSHASTFAAAVGLVLVVGANGPVSAHRLDEYLQVARVAIGPERVEVELDLTPGVAIAEKLLASIDGDGDGVLSNGEQQAYESAVLGGLRLELDGQPVGLVSTGFTFPDADAMRRGEGTIRLRTTGALPSVSGGNHRLLLRNTHRADSSVYLANALVPATDRVTVLAQHRDLDQRELAIDYFLQGAPSFAAAGWLVIGIAALVWASRLLARPVRTV